ncbi:MAG: aminotransferase class III-fold pyridoxal phosphate-dependent enzyme [Pseudomonadota bacterium]
MEKNSYMTFYRDHFAPCLKKATDLVVERAEGCHLYTMDGEKYLDFVQGIAVNPLGHCHPALVEAACAQVRKMAHVSFNLVTYPSALELAAGLEKVLPKGVEAFFFSNSGAEAVDGALKLARYATGKPSIIAFRGSFHGRTMGAASVTASNASFRKHYAPFMPQVYFAPYPYCFRCAFGQKSETCDLQCLEYLKLDFNYVIPPEDVSAVLFEPIQGEGGYVVPPARYVEGLDRLCKEHGILLILDEIQTGMGRTGKMFAAEHFKVEPDIMLLGKAVGGGYPLSVIAGRKEVMDKWQPGAHGTTFGGHPVACASGLAQLDIISKPEFLQAVRDKGDYFRSALLKLKDKYPVIGDVRGLGLMAAIELVKPDGSINPDAAAQVIKKLFENKILTLNCGFKGQAVRFIPPLNVEKVYLDEVLGVVEKALAEL